MITDKTLIKLMSDRWKLYHSNYKELAIARMLEIYSKANEIKLTAQIDLTNNIFKNIIEEISQVYSYGVDRNIDNETMVEMYKKINVNSFMIEADKKLNAFNDLIIQVSFDDKKKVPKLIFRYPHKTKVITDDFGNPEYVEYFVEIIDKKEKWAYWSDTEHYYKIYEDTETFKIEYLDGNENGVNPFGVMPFVFMANGYRDLEFFDIYTGQDLVAITLDNAIYQTFKKYLIKWQSFKQLVVTGSNVGAISGQMLDPQKALTAEGDNIDIKLLDLQANLAQLDESLKSDINQVLVNYKISPSMFNMTSQLTSGFAMQMENIARDNQTIQRQFDFVEYETQLNFIIATVLNTNGINVPLDDFSITFNKPTYPLSKQEKLDIYTRSIDLAIKSPVEIIMEEYEIEENEATIKLQNNIQKRNELYQKVNQNSLNMDTTTQALLGANSGN